MIWKKVKHSDLSNAESFRIAELKDQHWQYGIKSQMIWMRDNIQIDDVHLMGEDIVGDKVVLNAYITISKIKINIDGDNYDALGVGGVCVHKEKLKTGLGRQLITEANNYIRKQKQLGVLLCKEHIVKFYEKNGWYLLRYQSASVAENNFNNIIMVLDKNISCVNVIIDRNF